LARAIDLEPGETDLATLPVFVLANLASGVTTLLPDCDLRKPGAIDPAPVLAQLRAQSPGRTGGSPAFYEQLLEGIPETISNLGAEPSPLSCLAKLFTGGAPVFPGLLCRLQEQIPDGRIIAVYGSTEAEPIAHIEWAEFSPEDIERMATGGGLLAGLPVPEVELRILPNESGSPIEPLTTTQFENRVLSVGEPGEIVVSGGHVIESYLDGIGDEETKFSVENRRWHRTGDAGYLDAKGRVWLLGRASAVLDDAKGTLFPFSVECAASQFPDIRRSALAAHGGKRILVLELRTSGPGAGTSSGLEGRVLESLMWAGLDRVAIVPKIPVDRRHNAKIDYVELRKLIEKLSAEPF
jgi:acyl-CoA synthetase (AMP-forming)/AMP-acid ligase II